MTWSFILDLWRTGDITALISFFFLTGWRDQEAAECWDVPGVFGQIQRKRGGHFQRSCQASVGIQSQSKTCPQEEETLPDPVKNQEKPKHVFTSCMHKLGSSWIWKKMAEPFRRTRVVCFLSLHVEYCEPLLPLLVCVLLMWLDKMQRWESTKWEIVENAAVVSGKTANRLRDVWFRCGYSDGALLMKFNNCLYLITVHWDVTCYCCAIHLKLHQTLLWLDHGKVIVYFDKYHAIE